MFTKGMVILATGIFWAVMMSVLVRHEILPYFEYQAPPSYRSMLQGRQVAEVYRRSILFGHERVGQSTLLIEPLPSGFIDLHNRFEMNVGHFLEGINEWVDPRLVIRSSIVVNPTYQLHRFVMEGRFGVPIELRGFREGDKLRVAYDFSISRGERTVECPRDTTLADSVMPYIGGGRLAVGKRWKIQMVDLAGLLSPLQNGQDLLLSFVYATVESREAIRWQGRETPVFRVDIRREPNQEIPSFRLWVDDAGRVLEEELMISKLPYRIILDEWRELTPEEVTEIRKTLIKPKGGKGKGV